MIFETFFRWNEFPDISVEMAWFSGKVSLGGFPDLTGAVNKFQESVKNIEKNFDNALGFDDKSDSAAEGALLPTFFFFFSMNRQNITHPRSQ